MPAAGESPSAARLRRAALAAAICVYLALACYASWHRLGWSDEGWYADPAYNLARHGRMVTTVFDPSRGLTRIDQHTYWIFPFSVLSEALWFRIFPATLFSARIHVILWGLLAIAAFYRIVARITGNRVAAAFAAGALALDYTFLDNSAFARPDIMCCALGLSGLAAYLELRGGSLWIALLAANAFLAGAIMTHPNGIFHIAGLLLLIAVLDRKRLTLLNCVAAALPYLAAIGMWMPYVLQDWGAFRDQLTQNGTNSRWTPTLNPIAILYNELRERYWTLFGLKTGGSARLKVLVLVSYFGSTALLLCSRRLRQQKGATLLLALLGLYFVELSVFNQKLSYYFVHILPWYVAILAVVSLWLWTSAPRFRPVLAGWLVLLLGVQCGGIVLRARQRSAHQDEAAAADFLRRQGTGVHRIAATAALLFYLDFDPRLIDDPTLGTEGSTQPDAVVIGSNYRDIYDGWATARPQAMERIRQRLSGYRLTYENREYSVYFLK
jgi:4-amino-4-deoxy-L-arabinose transferase-like glycosyltransferase